MKKLVSLLMWMIPIFIFAQENKKDPIVDFIWSGFVKADYIYDSRQNYEGREGFFIAYPKPIELDANGLDKNAYASANQYGMTTRLGLTASGPEIFNAKSLAYIEGDFTGPSNAHNNAFRLRHAYIHLQWEKTSLLMGQYWHPLNVPEMLPVVLSLNTGAPMHAFSRGPQIRITQKTGPIDWVAVAYAQRDYASNGPAGVSSIYLRNAIIPDLSLQMQIRNRNWFSGLGINYKKLDFRSYTIDDQLLHNDVSSLAITAFVKHESEKWDIRVQSILGQNLYDHLMLGGVAVTEIDSINAFIQYGTISSFSTWTSIYYKFGKFKIGVFGGYTKPIALDYSPEGPTYARGSNINEIYRISPQWYYKIKNLIIANEWEYTVASYTFPSENGEFPENCEVRNLRFTFSLIYIF